MITRCLVVVALVLSLALPAEAQSMAESSSQAVSYKSGLRIVRLKGDPYSLGFQHGRLIPTEVKGFVDQILGYFGSYVKIDLLEKIGVKLWLAMAWKDAKPFISPDYIEELKGLADGSGVELSRLYQVHAIPDRTYTCANFAAWHRATDGGRLIHLRNLDWSIESGIQDYATVFVVRPEGKQAFVNIGWSGFVGVITGINDRRISIGQIGAETTEATFAGEPIAFLMRRTLEENDNLNGAVETIVTADRTVGINYVLGDALMGKGTVIETNAKEARVFQANDPKEKGIEYARTLPDAVFRADTAMDPLIRDRQIASHGKPDKPGLEFPAGNAYEVRYLGQAEMIKRYFGRLNVEQAKDIARTIAPDSNIQSVIFAWPQLFIANAKGLTPAAQTEYAELDLRWLFWGN